MPIGWQRRYPPIHNLLVELNFSPLFPYLNSTAKLNKRMGFSFFHPVIYSFYFLCRVLGTNPAHTMHSMNVSLMKKISTKLSMFLAGSVALTTLSQSCQSPGSDTADA